MGSCQGGSVGSGCMTSPRQRIQNVKKINSFPRSFDSSSRKSLDWMLLLRTSLTQIHSFLRTWSFWLGRHGCGDRSGCPYRLSQLIRWPGSDRVPGHHERSLQRKWEQNRTFVAARLLLLTAGASARLTSWLCTGTARRTTCSAFSNMAMLSGMRL